MTELKIGMKFKARPTIAGETWSRGTVCGNEYEIHGVTLATERFSYKDSAGDKVYMPFEDFDKYFELVGEDVEQMTELKVGMKIKLKERSIECLDWCKNTTYSKEYKIVYLNTFKETCGYRDNNNNIVYMPIENFNFYFDIVEEKEIYNSKETWKVGDKFKFKNRYVLLSDCSLEESFEVYDVSEHMIKFRDSNGVARFLLGSELENRIEKIQQEEESVKVENRDKEYKIGDKVFIDIEKFAREWSGTANRLSPDIPYEIFAYGNPKDPERYYGRASDGSIFYFLDKHVNKAKTATLNREQEIEECMTNEDEVTKEIQQKLEYMGLSLPAIQDIMQMVNDACTESYQNGIAAGKNEMKMDLEKFIGG